MRKDFPHFFSLPAVPAMDTYPVCFLRRNKNCSFVPFCRWPISVLSDLKSRQSIRMHMQAIPLPLPLPRARARTHVVAVASRMCHVASCVSCQVTNRVTTYTRAYAHTTAQKRNTGQCIIRQSLVELQRFAQNKTTNRLHAHIFIVRYTYIGRLILQMC